jgi:hypothetical protein
MRPLTLLAMVGLASASIPPALRAQAEHVFRITAADCRFGGDRVLTGFRYSGQPGIVTALHGVVGCSRITAVRPIAPGRPLLSYQVQPRAVSIASDLALLGSAELDALPAVGLLVAPSAPAGDSRVLGYPHALPATLTTTLHLRVPPTVMLNQLLPSGVANDGAFRARQSPHPKISVLSVEGHLTLGYSGAPLVDDAGRVFGVANGGLASGALEISWAIPFLTGQVAWSPVATARTDLDRLGQLDAELLFAFATESREFPDVSCTLQELVGSLGSSGMNSSTRAGPSI